MAIVSVAQIASAIGTVGLTILFGFQLLVFRKQVAVNSDTLLQMRESRTAHERPQVLVTAEYRKRSVIELVVRNIGRGAAKNITFEFSASLESSISDQEHPEVKDPGCQRLSLPTTRRASCASSALGRDSSRVPCVRRRCTLSALSLAPLMCQGSWGDLSVSALQGTRTFFGRRG